MKKNKFVIFCLCTIILIVICMAIYFIFNDKIFYPFESNKISYIKDNNDYSHSVKKGIIKIVISSETKTDTIENNVEISEFISKLNDYNGYQISHDKVPLGSKTSIILHTPDSTLTIFLSSSSISINDTHYQTITNYLEELN